MIGQNVRVLNKERKIWFLGTITSQHSDKSYNILTEAGRNIRRNRVMLRPVTEHQNPLHMPPLLTTLDTPVIDVPQQHDVQQKPPTPKPDRTKPPQPAATCSNLPSSDTTSTRTRSGRVIKAPVRYQS